MLAGAVVGGVVGVGILVFVLVKFVFTGSASAGGGTVVHGGAAGSDYVSMNALLIDGDELI